jgi:tRNA (guanine-N(7)-)-methyltransferase subunit TRM82
VKKANEQLQGASRLQYCAKQANGQWCETVSMKDALRLFAKEGSKINVGPSSGGMAENKTVRDVLYHVENLRKRPGAED